MRRFSGRKAVVFLCITVLGAAPPVYPVSPAPIDLQNTAGPLTQAVDSDPGSLSPSVSSANLDDDNPLSAPTTSIVLEDGTIQEYDNAGRLIKNISPDGVTSEFFYREDGTLERITRDEQDRRSRFNVLDYGAKGDGVTDDSSAFRAAQNAATEAGGGIIFVPHTAAGYVIGSFSVRAIDGRKMFATGTSIDLTDNTAWIGETAGGEKTKLIHYARTAEGRNDLFQIADASNVTIEGFEIAGEGRIATGINIHGVVENVRIQKVHLHDLANYAISYGSESTDPDVDRFRRLILNHIQIDGITGLAGDGSGIDIFPRGERNRAPVSSGLYILNSTIDVTNGGNRTRDHGPQAVKVNNTDGVVIKNVETRGGSVAGVVISNGAQNVLINHVQTSFAERGLLIGTGSNRTTSLTGNVRVMNYMHTAQTSGEIGIDISGNPFNVNISRSQIEGDIRFRAVPHQEYDLENVQGRIDMLGQVAVGEQSGARGEVRAWREPVLVLLNTGAPFIPGERMIFYDVMPDGSWVEAGSATMTALRDRNQLNGIQFHDLVIHDGNFTVENPAAATGGVSGIWASGLYFDSARSAFGRVELGGTNRAATNSRFENIYSPRYTEDTRIEDLSAQNVFDFHPAPVTFPDFVETPGPGPHALNILSLSYTDFDFGTMSASKVSARKFERFRFRLLTNGEGLSEGETVLASWTDAPGSVAQIAGRLEYSEETNDAETIVRKMFSDGARAVFENTGRIVSYSAAAAAADAANTVFQFFYDEAGHEAHILQSGVRRINYDMVNLTAVEMFADGSLHRYSVRRVENSADDDLFHMTRTSLLGRWRTGESISEAFGIELTDIKDDTVDVRTFRPVGDGVADDTAAIQTAAAFAGNKILRLVTGRYRMTAPLVIAGKSVTVQSDARAVLMFDFAGGMPDVKTALVDISARNVLLTRLDARIGSFRRVFSENIRSSGLLDLPLPTWRFFAGPEGIETVQAQRDAGGNFVSTARDQFAPSGALVKNTRAAYDRGVKTLQVTTVYAGAGEKVSVEREVFDRAGRVAQDWKTWFENGTPASRLYKEFSSGVMTRSVLEEFYAAGGTQRSVETRYQNGARSLVIVNQYAENGWITDTVKSSYDAAGQLRGVSNSLYTGGVLVQVRSQEFAANGERLRVVVKNFWRDGVTVKDLRIDSYRAGVRFDWDYFTYDDAGNIIAHTHGRY